MMSVRHRNFRGEQARINARRASVSVEFALVSLFFLFPLIAGGIDMVLVLSARSKLNSALHSIYLFAWSDPQSAADNAQLQSFIQSIDPALPTSAITLTNTPAVANVCLDSSGNVDAAATFTAGQTGTGAASGTSGSSVSNDTCTLNGAVVPGDVPAAIASYNLSSTVQLPIPVPFIVNPITLTASGTIQIQ